jgi:hypothetical protein
MEEGHGRGQDPHRAVAPVKKEKEEKDINTQKINYFISIALPLRQLNNNVLAISLWKGMVFKSFCSK